MPLRHRAIQGDYIPRRMAWLAGRASSKRQRCCCSYTWANTQRHSLSKKSPSKKEAARIELLDALPGWQWPAGPAGLQACAPSCATAARSVYVAQNNETPTTIAKKLHCDAAALVQLNLPSHKGLALKSKVRAGTLLHIPGVYSGAAALFRMAHVRDRKDGGHERHCRKGAKRRGQPLWTPRIDLSDEEGDDGGGSSGRGGNGGTTARKASADREACGSRKDASAEATAQSERKRKRPEQAQRSSSATPRVQDSSPGDGHALRAPPTPRTCDSSSPCKRRGKILAVGAEGTFDVELAEGEIINSINGARLFAWRAPRKPVHAVGKASAAAAGVLSPIHTVTTQALGWRRWRWRKTSLWGATWKSTSRVRV